jgi:aspartyl protease family protein
LDWFRIQRKNHGYPAAEVVSATAPQPLLKDDLERIPLSARGSVPSVSVQINGALALSFIIDTGASQVAIPEDVALTLMRTGTITESDFVGSAQFTLADGSMVEKQQVNLRSLKLGSRTIHNVRASIGSVKSPLLLGQTALRQLEPWRVDSTSNHLVLGE